MKQLLAKMAAGSDTLTDIGLLVLRLWFGLVMALAHGWPKVGKIDTFTEGVANMGMPLPGLLAPAAIGAELVGGIFLALGLLARPSAAGILITMLVAAFVRHADDPFSKQEFALAYAFAALCIVIAGPGRLSLDHTIFGRDR